MTWLNTSESLIDIVVEIYPVKSSKGYVLKGIEYDCFVWKSDKTFQQLLIALASWIDSKQGKQIEIYRETVTSQEVKFRLSKVKGKEVPAIWNFKGAGYTTLEEVSEDNPFL